MKEKQISLTALYLYLTTALAAIASAVLLSAFNLIKANAADLKPEIQSSAQLSLILTTATIFLIVAVASAFAYLIFYVLTYIKNNQITGHSANDLIKMINSSNDNIRGTATLSDTSKFAN